ELESGDHALARDATLRPAASRHRARANSGVALPRAARNRARRRNSPRTQKERNSADTRARGRARRFGGAGGGRVAIALPMARCARSSAERRADLLDAPRHIAKRSSASTVGG